MCLCLFVFEIYWKLIEEFTQSLHMDILYPAVQHQVKQVVNHFWVFSQKQISLEAFWLKHFKILTFCSAHCINHFFSDFNWRRIWLWISPQYKTKINMEHFSIWWDQKIFQMSITNTKKISDWTISSTTKNIIFHYQFWALITLLKLL